MKERMHIFPLAVPTVAAGRTLQGISARLDFDAPFAVRSWSAFRADGGVAGGDDFVLARVQGPSGRYLHSDFVPLSRIAPASTASQWTPVYPELVYPAGAVVALDVRNLLGVPLTGLVLMVRGVKLFQDGADLPGASAYPERFSSLPFDLPRWHTLAVAQELDNVALNAPPDAAMVVRSIGLQKSSKTTANPAIFTNLFCRLRDSNHKAYMSDWVRYSYLFDLDPSEPRPVFPQFYLPPSGSCITISCGRTLPARIQRSALCSEARR